MPDPTGAESCAFEGVASSVRVEGKGAPVLTEREPFQAPIAARVTFRGAALQLEGTPMGPAEMRARREVTLDRPAKLMPVGMSAGAGAGYDVTYSAGPPVVVHVAAGGAAGSFRGELAGAPECATEWCDIVWTGDRKTVVLEVDPQIGAQEIQKGVRLATGFHFVPDAFAAKKPGLSAVTLEGARGRLRCGGGAVEVDDARQVWRTGDLNSLALVKLDLTAGGIAVEVQNERAPERSPGGGVATGWAAVLGAAGVGLLGLAVLGRVLLARRRRRLIAAGATSGGGGAAGGASREAPVRPTTLFYSYSHEDEQLRAELEKHLKILERTGLLQGFHDRKIMPGADWREELDQNLAEADVILLLISASFLASDYCYGIEMKRALERHSRGEATVIPVLLSPCLWREGPFAKLQALPASGRPISQWADREEALANVAEGIKSAILAR